jgi:hypothetical protein
VLVLSRRDETGDYVLDILNKHISTATEGCSVSAWIETLEDEEKHAFTNIREHSDNINVSSLYKDLSLTDDLPFKLTAFRSHLRSYCTCPKN